MYNFLPNIVYTVRYLISRVISTSYLLTATTQGTPNCWTLSICLVRWGSPFSSRSRFSWQYSGANLPPGVTWVHGFNSGIIEYGTGMWTQLTCIQTSKSEKEVKPIATASKIKEFVNCSLHKDCHNGSQTLRRRTLGRNFIYLRLYGGGFFKMQTLRRNIKNADSTAELKK